MSEKNISDSIKVLFVCMGNICRSPTAESVFNKLIKEQKLEDKFIVDSAGTHGYHVGAKADSRSREFGEKRGYEFKSRSRKFNEEEDFDFFDYILVADQQNLEHLQWLGQEREDSKKLFLMSHWSKKFQNSEVPDPYYGGEGGFDHVLDMLEESMQEFLSGLLVQE